MDVAKTFRKLVTNQYMPDFNYGNTDFKFQTVFHKTAHAYCFCICGFKHEYFDYISESMKINEKVYEKVLQCILAGNCPHVGEVPEYYIRESSVNGLHIAAVVETNKALTGSLDIIDEMTSGLFGLNPYQIALIKNPAGAFKLILEMCNLSGDLTILDASRISNENSRNTIQIEQQTIIEYCARKGAISALKMYIQTTTSGKDFISTLQVAFKYQLVDLQNLLKHKWDRMLGRDLEDILEECCTLAIVYDKPEFLYVLLHHVGIRKKLVTCKCELANNLNTICDALQRPSCKHILSIKRNAFAGYDHRNPSRSTISTADRVKTILYLLFTHNFNYSLREELLPILSAIPNVSYFLNASEVELVRWLRDYNFSMGMYDPQFLKMFLDLGLDVNRSGSYKKTPFIQTLAMKRVWCRTVFRDAEELYVYENLDLQVNKAALVRGLKADQSFYHLNPEDMHYRIGERKVFIMDSKMHGMQGHDESDFALNFSVPLLIECGFPVLQDFFEVFEEVKDSLDPVEQAYITNYLDTPRPLLWICRDTLRAYYKGRQIHKFVKTANIPQQVKDFILLKPLLKCVSKHLLIWFCFWCGMEDSGQMLTKESCCNILRRTTRKCTSIHMHQAKIQISMLIRSVWSDSSLVASWHYENTPIQICRKFHLQKLKKFSDEKLWYFSYFCSKHRLWVLVRTASSRRF